MGDDAQFIAELADLLAAGQMTGDPLEKIVEAQVKKSGLKMTADEVRSGLKADRLPKLPAHLLASVKDMHPRDLESTLESAGSGFREAVEAIAGNSEDVKKLSKAALADIVGNPDARTIAEGATVRSVARVDFLQWLDLSYQQTAAIWQSALDRLGDPLLVHKIGKLTTQIPLQGNLESFAAYLAQRLPQVDAPKLLNSVHTEICEEIAAQLRAAIDDDSVLQSINAALDEVKAQGGTAVAPAFRARLRALFGDSAAGSVVEQIARRLDGSEREQFLQVIFESMGDQEVLELLATYFDTEGKLRLLSSFESFRKVYSFTRMQKAKESLIGWLYESTKFVEDLAVSGTAKAKTALEAALLQTHAEVEVGASVIHFDVKIGNLQATDLWGTVSLTGQGGTVHLILLGLEAKGEEGIAKGFKQLGNLRARLANGALVETEHGTFIAGKDLFLSIEEALLQINAPKDVAKTVRQLVRGNEAGAFTAIIVSPLDQPTAPIAESLAKANVQYVTHPVPRAKMQRVADSLAPHFNLLPLKP
jgi:hypothetical protein